MFNPQPDTGQTGSGGNLMAKPANDFSGSTCLALLLVLTERICPCQKFTITAPMRA
jgi:hypothetical protein